jgi:hypothetical protein
MAAVEETVFGARILQAGILSAEVRISSDCRGALLWHWASCGALAAFPESEISVGFGLTWQIQQYLSIFSDN